MLAWKSNIREWKGTTDQQKMTFFSRARKSTTYYKPLNRINGIFSYSTEIFTIDSVVDRLFSLVFHSMLSFGFGTNRRKLYIKKKYVMIQCVRQIRLSVDFLRTSERRNTKSMQYNNRSLSLWTKSNSQMPTIDDGRAIAYAIIQYDFRQKKRFLINRVCASTTNRRLSLSAVKCVRSDVNSAQNG